tara:strand:+ start:568 stop:867 length:300 start_codon:yes stop_codon:yes gene_type:complete
MMAKEAHTPGPWEWAKNYAGLFGPDGAEVLPFAPYENIWVPYYSGSGEADARLIAAAPDMKDAIAEVLHFHDSGGHEGDLDEALRLCRAAIAKARGEAS